MNTIFKNQNDMAAELKQLINDYWKKKITEETLFKKVKIIRDRNEVYLFEPGSTEIAPTVKTRLGKKRMRVLNEILR